MSNPQPSFARRHAWRVGLLLLFAAAVVAGTYAFRCAFVSHYPASISPDGSQFIANRYIQTSEHIEASAHIADIKTGEIQFDLPVFDDRIAHWQWAPDRMSVYGIARTKADSNNTRLIHIDLSGSQPKIVSDETLEKNIAYASILPGGNVVHVERHEGGTDETDGTADLGDSPYLSLVVDGQEVSRLEYGQDDYAYVSGYPDNRSILGVVFSDTKSTSKRKTLVQFDARTGKQLHETEISPRFDGRVFATSKYIIKPVSGKPTIVGTGENTLGDGNGLGPADPADTILLVNDDLVVTQSRTRLYVYPRTGLTAPTRTLQMVDEVLVVNEQSILVATFDGKLISYDPNTGETKPLWNARTWRREAGFFAIATAGLFPFLWLFVSARRHELPAFAECGLMLLLLFGGLLLWWQFGMPNCRTKRDISALQVYLILATSLPLAVIWASSAKSTLAKLAPPLTIGLCVLLFVTIATTNTAMVAEFVVSVCLLLLWNFGLLHCLRKRWGPIAHADHAGMNEIAMRFNIRHLIGLTAGFAFVFTVLRFTGDHTTMDSSGLRVATDGPEHVRTFLWLLGNAGICVLVAYLCIVAILVLHRRLRGLELVLVLFGLILFCFLSYFVVRRFEVYADPYRLAWYPLTFVSGLLVTACFAHIRSGGYGFSSAR